MVTINTNLSSLIVQRNLTNSTNCINQTIEHMTTGFKINHARDNAANYSISENMTSQLSSYHIAQENVSMGLDMVSTAMDTISELQNRGERLAALWTQAQNGTYDEKSINAIQQETDSIVSEINRIYNNAEYNGVELFNILPDWAQTVKTNAGTNSELSPNKSGFIENPVSKSKTYVDELTHVSEISDFTSAAEYQISTIEDLTNFAVLVNAGKDTTGKTFYLGADIDISVIDNWNAIGNSTENDFKGTFDGNGHSVYGLKIDNKSGTQGLFAYLNESATVKNLGVTGNIVAISNNSGILAGVSYGTITNCYTKGTINGTSMVGGLIGQSYGEINFCYSNVNISANGNHVGGLVGDANGTITNCFATGNVSAKGSAYRIGGLVGLSKEVITNCYATGNVYGESTAVGGLVGRANAEINNCCATGNVIGTSGIVGGLVGAMYKHLKNSYATGNIISNGDYGGGLAGHTNENCKVENCYSTGNVTGTRYTGGLIGRMNEARTNCFSTGCVEGTDLVGGLVGYISNDVKTNMSNAFCSGSVKGNEFVGGLVGQIYKTTGTMTVNNGLSCAKVHGNDKVGSFVGGVVSTTSGTSFGTINFTNCEANGRDNVIGGEYKFSSNTYTLINHSLDEWNAEIKKSKQLFKEINFQVGIYGNGSSNINVNTSFGFDLNIKDISSSNSYNTIKTFLDIISSKSTELGAIYNRLEKAMESVNIDIENLTSSR